MGVTMPVRVPRWVRRVLKGRTDAVLIGAWAVNCYLPPNDRRWSSDVDIVSLRPMALGRLIAKEVGGECFRATDYCWAVKKGDWILAEVHKDASLPPAVMMRGIPVVTKSALIQMKKEAAGARRGTPKGLTDERDLMVLQKEANVKEGSHHQRD